MANATLGVQNLCDVMRVFWGALREHRESLNRLNVYPVPDGDTGTNMALTLKSVVDSIDSIRPVGDMLSMQEVCKGISQGSLMGARGNSGVILSQLLRGFTDNLRELDTISSADLVQSLSQASQSAYEAVLRPVEGTILTVARRAAEGAQVALENGQDLSGVVIAAISEAEVALDETPTLLSALAQAGVVDAGGSGYLLFLRALANVIDGTAIPSPLPSNDVASEMAGPIDIHVSHDSQEQAQSSIADLRYEVMFLLEAPDELLGGFKKLWGSLGDSIVVVGGDGLFNCHIHTDDVGASIEAALEVGRPRQIRVTDLLDQVGALEVLEEERWVREGAKTQNTNPEEICGGKDQENSGQTCVVCVANGEGIRRIFLSLGVHEIIHGGQSMNPSTQDVLDAIERAPSNQVLVLPNNPNIIPVAVQASQLSSKEVLVLPTRSIPQAFEALLVYDPDARVEDNFKEMESELESARYGEVTRAVRDATTDVGAVKAGQWIGLDPGGVRVVGDSLAETSCELLSTLIGGSCEIVTIIEGEGSSSADTRHITVWLSDNYGEAEVEIHHGGQPLYPYLFGIE